MIDFGPATFGELNAHDYDTFHDPGTTDLTVERVAELAAGGPGRIFELAIGTGRIALPLAARGFSVAGIDGSAEMVAKLREKPGGTNISVTIGDMAEIAVEGPFDISLLVYNTLFNVLTQDRQVRCFQNAANGLVAGGLLIIEAFVPDVGRFRDHQCVRMNRLSADTVWLEAAHHDPSHQRIDHQRIRFTPSGISLVPLPMRYAWPSEIDLMARLAGLTLSSRWADWNKAPFTADSRAHISIYRKPA